MWNYVIIITGLVLIGGLLIAEKKERIKGKLLTKPLASICFILLAIVQHHPVPVYYHWILAGLVFSFGGDVFLAFPNKAMFLQGLILFLIGHVLYVFGFHFLVPIFGWFQISALIVALISIAIFLWLKPNLGAMMGPVAGYIIVISVMLMGAMAVFSSEAIPGRGRFLVLSGAILFYISDLFVARDRFVKTEFLNRCVGLPVYYAGQFLLALSVNLG